MSGKNAGKDMLTRALEDTPVTREQTSPSDVSEQPTPRAQPVGQVLERLEAQAKDAMPDSFFDGGTTTQTTPIRKRMRSEAGTMQINAKRRKPSVEASVAIDVTSARDEEGEAGHYHVRAEAHLAREGERGVLEADVPLSIAVYEADGGLNLDSAEMQHEIANAIRSTGADPAGAAAVDHGKDSRPPSKAPAD
jgi:hypothetical protein